MSLGDGEDDPERTEEKRLQRWQGKLWDDVAGTEVIAFLNGYRTHPVAYKVNSVLLAEFITRMNAVGELTKWTVAVIGGGRGESPSFADDLSVAMLKRASEGAEGRYSIGRLLSPRDEGLDLTAAEWNAALSTTQASWKPDPARAKSTEGSLRTLRARNQKGAR